MATKPQLIAVFCLTTAWGGCHLVFPIAWDNTNSSDSRRSDAFSGPADGVTSELPAPPADGAVLPDRAVSQDAPLDPDGNGGADANPADTTAPDDADPSPDNSTSPDTIADAPLPPDLQPLPDTGTPVLHWTEMASNTTAALNAVCGNSPTDVYAVGEAGTVVHYDGLMWTPLTQGTYTMTDLWCDGTDEVFIAEHNSSQGRVRHYDGISWQLMTVPPMTAPLYAIWGASLTDIFAAGASGTLLRWTGSGWVKMASPTTQDIQGIWGTNATNLFAVGTGGQIIRFTGSSWWSDASPTPKELRDVSGNGPSNVYAVGNNVILHFDGSTWTPMTAGVGWLFAAWGSGAAATFASGNDVILQHDGTAWTPMDPGVGGAPYYNGIWGTSATNVYIVGSGGLIVHWGT